jgi:hypothetical protein
MDALTIWTRLNRPSFIVLSLPGFRFVRPVNYAER